MSVVRNPDIRMEQSRSKPVRIAKFGPLADWGKARQDPSMVRVYLQFLIAEVFVVFIAMGSFFFISEKMLAGFFAGCCFVALGVWIVSSPIRNRALLRSLTFWVGAVYLFAISLPMMITRFLNTALEFQDVRILGLAGPEFHRLSTTVYTILLSATAIDLLLSIWRLKKARNGKKPTGIP